MQKKLIDFDVDGTLLQFIATQHRAMAHAMAASDLVHEDPEASNDVDRTDCRVRYEGHPVHGSSPTPPARTVALRTTNCSASASPARLASWSRPSRSEPDKDSRPDAVDGVPTLQQMSRRWALAGDEWGDRPGAVDRP